MKVLLPVLSLAVLLAGCAGLMPKLEPPQLSISNVELLDSSLWEQRLRVRMRVRNPNDRALPVRGLTYALEVGGQELAQGVADNSFVVPALGETQFDMTVTTSMALTLLRLASRGGGSSGGEIEYRLHGKVSLSQGLLRSIPFEDRGSFSLK